MKTVFLLVTMCTHFSPNADLQPVCNTTEHLKASMEACRAEVARTQPEIERMARSVASSARLDFRQECVEKAPASRPTEQERRTLIAVVLSLVSIMVGVRIGRRRPGRSAV